MQLEQVVPLEQRHPDGHELGGVGGRGRAGWNEIAAKVFSSIVPALADTAIAATSFPPL